MRALKNVDSPPSRAVDTVPLASGNRMPVLGLGSWMLTSHTAERVTNAIALGYRMVDTSGDYQTQGGIGRAIRASGMPRDELFIVTKVEEDDDGYDATRKNLDELKLEYADLVLIHRPPERGCRCRRNIENRSQSQTLRHRGNRAPRSGRDLPRRGSGKAWRAPAMKVWRATLA